MRLALCLAAALTALAAHPARADVVPAEPETCPGGQPATCHGGAHCRLLPCESDASCSGGLTCQPRELCLGTVNCAGMLAPDEDASKYDVDEVLGACDASCTRCEAVMIRASGAGGGGGGTPGTSTSSGSSCAGGPAGALGLAWLVALAPFVLRRKAR